MTRLPMSRAAAALLRALLARVAPDENRILLSEFDSTDWQSLTFSGERHRLLLRICGPDAEALHGRLTGGLEDVEFQLPGLIVADIRAGQASDNADQGMEVAIEALTIDE